MKTFWLAKTFIKVFWALKTKPYLMKLLTELVAVYSNLAVFTMPAVNSELKEIKNKANTKEKKHKPIAIALLFSYR